MKIIKPSTEITYMPDGIEVLKMIERAGRTCYKSEDKISDESCKTFVASIIKRGHEAMLEFADATVKFVCDRGVSHEIVRHRIASYAQESTRYCNYSGDKFGKEITVVEPCFWPIEQELSLSHKVWALACMDAERHYFKLLELGASAQEARSVLPNSLKTEINVKYNMREWRAFFKLRCATAAHPQMRELTIPLLKEFKKRVPVLFDDIFPELV